MALDLNDTIVAPSSSAGPGARGVVRLSGPDAFRCVASLFAGAEPLAFNRRRLISGQVRLPGVAAPLPADLYVFPAPASTTGQHVAELHTLGCPPLLELLIAELLRAGARAARPGEFTLRAFLAGKLDLTRAEAVLGVIEAGSRDELKGALAQLAGGVARPLHDLRGDLLDLLADLEAGLDFAEEDLHFVSTDDLLRRIGKGLALMTLLGKQLEQRALGGRPFRVVLAGRPNVGKSSLFNALTGGTALVSPLPGTTRDYLVRRLTLEGTPIELIDTAGWRQAGDGIEAQALALGGEQAEPRRPGPAVRRDGGRHRSRRRGRPATLGAGGAEGGHPVRPGAANMGRRRHQRNDRGRAGRPAGGDRGMGPRPIPVRPGAQREPLPASCGSRPGALRRAHQMVLFGEAPELVALELRGALDELGEMTGAIHTDDLLDRIFSRFCIGK